MSSTPYILLKWLLNMRLDWCLIQNHVHSFRVLNNKTFSHTDFHKFTAGFRETGIWSANQKFCINRGGESLAPPSSMYPGCHFFMFQVSQLTPTILIESFPTFQTILPNLSDMFITLLTLIDVIPIKMSS